MAMIWRRPFGYQPGLGTAVNPPPSSTPPPGFTPAVLQSPGIGGTQLGTVDENVPMAQLAGAPQTAARPNGLQAFKHGGVVKKTGPALVHKGERVLSKSQNRRFTKAHPAIQKSHRGRLHAALGVATDAKIPIAKIHEAMSSKNAHLRKMATYANTMRTKWNH